MTTVSNTTSISELAKIGRLNLLRDVYRRLLIPQEVYDELITGTHAAAAIVPTTPWIEIQPVSNPHLVIQLQALAQIGAGECGAIILAEELQADYLLLDDRDARREAQRRGLFVTGTLGTLLFAKQRGLIPTVKEPLDQLLAHGTRIKSRLYQEVLALAGE